MGRRIGVILILVLPCLTQGDQASTVAPREKAGLIRALQARVAALLSTRNEAGISFQRGSFSTRFIEVGPETYQSVFHRETAGIDTLLVERMLLTLAPEKSGGAWSIVTEKVQDTYSELSRPVPGDEKFLRFDSFSLEREGLKISSGPGSLYQDFRLGKPERLVLRAASLGYTYRPPLEVDQVRHHLITETHAGDFVFAPEEIEISCDTLTCEQILSTTFHGARPAGLEEVDAGLRRSHEAASREEQQARRQDAFHGFALPDEADRRRLAIEIKKQGRDHWLVLDHDTIEPREVTLWVSGYGPVLAYQSEQSRKGASATELERRPDRDQRDYDVEEIEGTVELGFGDGEVMAGDITVRLSTRRQLRGLPFALARFSKARNAVREARDPRLTVNSLQDGAGRDLTWVSTGPASGLVVLPESVPAGTAVALRIVFENRDCIYKFTPNYFYVARDGWLPFLNLGDMVRRFDLTVKVPARFQAISVGTKASESTEGGASITRWISREAVSFPTVIFGGYKEAASKVKAVKKDGTAIPVVTHIDRDSVLSVSPTAPQNVADQAAHSLNLYQRLFEADYPYGKLDLVNDPGEALFGQAPSSIVYIGSGYDFSVQKGVGQMTKPEIERFQRSLVPHEVAHQWWGSLVTGGSPRHRWFEEALAEYSSALYFQAVDGVEGYLTRVQDWRKDVIHTQMLVPVQDALVLWSDGGEPLRTSLYAKGPYVFHMMRSIWGDDRFFEFLRILTREHKGREIVTRDIQQAAEKVFGQKQDWFFDQWIRGVGIPEFTLRYATRNGENGGHLIEGQVEQRILVSQKLRPRRILEGEVFRCVVYVTATGKSGKEYQHGLDIKDRVTPFSMTIPEKTKSIVLNKYGETLAHDVIVSEGP